MGCLTVNFTRIGGDLNVVFAPVCGSSVGEVVLFDKAGKRLMDKNDKILTAKKA